MTNPFEESDKELADSLKFANKLGVFVTTRGTDARPVTQVLDKKTRKEVGGTELKRRFIEYYGSLS
jgi:hypothetical protein